METTQLTAEQLYIAYERRVQRFTHCIVWLKQAVEHVKELQLADDDMELIHAERELQGEYEQFLDGEYATQKAGREYIKQSLNEAETKFSEETKCCISEFAGGNLNYEYLTEIVKETKKALNKNV